MCIGDQSVRSVHGGGLFLLFRSPYPMGFSLICVCTWASTEQLGQNLINWLSSRFVYGKTCWSGVGGYIFFDGRSTPKSCIAFGSCSSTKWGEKNTDTTYMRVLWRYKWESCRGCIFRKGGREKKTGCRFVEEATLFTPPPPFFLGQGWVNKRPLKREFDPGRFFKSVQQTTTRLGIIIMRTKKYYWGIHMSTLTWLY